jgi:hypothetical protein
MAATCVELDGEQRFAFFRYLGRHGHGGLVSGSSQSGAELSPATRRLLRSDTEDPASEYALTLGLGRHAWKHGESVFTIEFREEGWPCGDVPSYFTRLRVYGDDGAALQAFLESALRYRPPFPPNKVWTYSSDRFGRWRETGLVPAQTFEDLFLPAAEVQATLAHVETFAASGERYARVGRAHKLCLLLLGPPGAGKSSFARALALKLQRELYSLSLSSLVSDAVCHELVGSMSSESMLLVEDFDSLGFSLAAGRKRGRDEERVGVSRSCFLNLLDGNCAPPRGSIVVLTANSSSGFDQALVRSGRVDRVVRFGEPQPPEIFAALRRLADEAVDREARFHAFCAQLRNSGKAGDLSMASIVDHVFRHPSDYLETVDELTQSCRERLALARDGDAASLYC